MNALQIDTIAALATPPGRSSVAMFRVSGADAFTICDRILRGRKSNARYASSTLHRARVIDPDRLDDTVDDVLVAVFHAPRSYSGENVVEITCHGGAVPIRRILQLLLAHGARHAEPGEFTLRAYLNGKLDLAQAEAVADLIDARSDEAHRLALAQQEGQVSHEVRHLRERALGVLARIEATIDFPEDVGEFPVDWCEEKLAGIKAGIDRLILSAGRGILIRDGARVVLVGSPNAGKSSLLNAMLRQDRAIVTAVPGTTRDVIEESVTVNGLTLRLSDTAGIRESSDELERLGIERSRSAAAGADVIVWVRDATAGPQADAADEINRLAPGVPIVTVWNKIDLLSGSGLASALPAGAHAVSALTGTGVDEFAAVIAREALQSRAREESAGVDSSAESSFDSGSAVISHARHLSALRAAAEAVGRGRQVLNDGLPLDFLSIELQSALDSLGAVTGETAPQDVIGEIFSKFCIGK